MAPDASDDIERFRERYAVSGTDALLAAEREALGSDYQGNGYTTLAEADLIGDLLDLGPGRLLVDVGAGCGWPGLYLAERDGCSVVCVDPVAEGCAVGRQRAAADGIGHRALTVRADARSLPIRAGSADAVVHTDLLC